METVLARARYKLPAAALLACLMVVPAALARVSSSAQISGVTVELVDLDPSDGIAPALTNIDPNALGTMIVARAGRVRLGGDIETDAALVHFAPLDVSASFDTAASHAASMPGGLLAEGSALGESLQYEASAETGNIRGFEFPNFLLTPRTQVVLTAFAEVQVSVVDALQCTYICESGSAFAQMAAGSPLQAITIDRLSATATVEAAGGSFQDGRSGTLSLTLINSGSEPLPVSYLFFALTSGTTTAPIPEPQTTALLAIGLAAIAIVVRRQRSGGTRSAPRRLS